MPEEESLYDILGVRPSATEAELQAWVRRHLAAFKVPVAIRFSQETLPRNANGKILKRELKALFEDRVEAAA